MIIAVNETLIDTTKIYQIGNVYGDERFLFDGTEEKAFEAKRLIHSAYRLRIKFLGDSQHVFSCPINISSSKGNYQNYVDNCHAAKAKLEDVRNKIVEYWNTSKSEIPQINF